MTQGKEAATCSYLHCFLTFFQIPHLPLLGGFTLHCSYYTFYFYFTDRGKKNQRDIRYVIDYIILCKTTKQFVLPTPSPTTTKCSLREVSHTLPGSVKNSPSFFKRNVCTRSSLPLQSYFDLLLSKQFQVCFQSFLQFLVLCHIYIANSFVCRFISYFSRRQYCFNKWFYQMLFFFYKI